MTRAARWLAVLTAGAALWCGQLEQSARGAGLAPRARPDAVATILGDAPVQAIRRGFLGVSLEYQAAGIYTDLPTTDTVLAQLIRNLAPGQTPVLRIGGDSTDHTWYPAPRIAKPAGVSYAVTPAWLAGVKRLTAAIDGKLILGINLEANNPALAGAEARALIDGVGASQIEALEVGNEPNVYAGLPWYTTASGRPVPGRGAAYSLTDYLRQFAAVRRALPRIALAGPALGQSTWMGDLGQILHAEPGIDEVTFHAYPLDRCFSAPDGPYFASLANLLNVSSSEGLAAQITPYVKVARAHHVGFRVDELNSVACGGENGISNTFASALWILDTLFAMARQGADGVNVHTFPSAGYRLFSIGQTGGAWSASVAPEYYGMLMFVQAAPPGSRLHTISLNGTPQVRAWATTLDGTVRVVLINTATSHSRVVDIRGSLLPGVPGTLGMLEAPSVSATQGVTLDGSSFAPGTTSGLLATAPVTTSVLPAAGGYQVTLPAGSAALLTIGRTGQTFYP